MTDTQLIAYYVALLIIEYSDPSNTPNALATIALLAGEAIANQIVGQVGAGFALTNIYGQSVAQGVQLNILGQWVGAERNMPNYPPSPFIYFGFEDTTLPYNPAIGGFGDTTVGAPSDYFDDTRGSGSATYIQTDMQMIELIQYLAAVENAYLSVANVDDILFEFFGIYATVTETSPMVITYADSVSDPATFYPIVKYFDAFPHPAGVEVIS